MIRWSSCSAWLDKKKKKMGPSLSVSQERTWISTNLHSLHIRLLRNQKRRMNRSMKSQKKNWWVTQNFLELAYPKNKTWCGLQKKASVPNSPRVGGLRNQQKMEKSFTLILKQVKEPLFIPVMSTTNSWWLRNEERRATNLEIKRLEDLNSMQTRAFPFNLK